MYEIEENLEIPSPSKTRGPDPLYPFREMKVGDSFFVPNKSPTKLSGVRGYWQMKLGRKFVYRSVDGGVRVWRTE